MRSEKKMDDIVAVKVTKELKDRLREEANKRKIRIPDLVRWILSDKLNELQQE